MKKKINNIVTIEEDLELLNPTMQMEQIHYDLINNTFLLEISYVENDGVFKHSRLYSYTNNTAGQLTMQMVIDEIVNSTDEQNQIVKKFIIEGIDV